MDFELPEEIKIIKNTMRDFVERELIPLEREFRPEGEEMPEELYKPLQEKAKALGFWMLDIPEEYGGAGLDLLTRCVIQEEVSRTIAIPFRNNPVFGPEARGILFELNDEQKERYLYPVIRGEKTACFAQTEPDAGGDPAGMKTRAVLDGDHWVLNGTKRFISNAGFSDFAQVMAVTDPEKRARGGITCFLVDMDTPGVTIERRWPTMMGDAPFQILFEDARIPVGNVAGEVGQGFRLAQGWLQEGRIKGHGARCVGIAERALDMMMDYCADPYHLRAAAGGTAGGPIHDRGLGHGTAHGAQPGLRMRLAPRPRRGHPQHGLHGQVRVHGDGQPGGGPLHPGPRRHRPHQGTAAGVVVPAVAKHPHHRGRHRGAALAHGPEPAARPCKGPMSGEARVMSRGSQAVKDGESRQ